MMKEAAAARFLYELFDQKTRSIGREQGLSDTEIERILTVFRQALANPYLDETKIYPRLIDPGPDS